MDKISTEPVDSPAQSDNAVSQALFSAVKSADKPKAENDGAAKFVDDEVAKLQSLGRDCLNSDKGHVAEQKFLDELYSAEKQSKQMNKPYLFKNIIGILDSNSQEDWNPPVKERPRIWFPDQIASEEDKSKVLQSVCIERGGLASDKHLREDISFTKNRNNTYKLGKIFVYP